VGHSLESDLNILGLCHQRVIDTVGLFPHHQGLPFKKSLKSVAKEYLHRDIQSDQKDSLASVVGHDSIEDAVVPLELLFALMIQSLDQSPCLPSSKTIPSSNSLPSVWTSTQSLLVNSNQVTPAPAPGAGGAPGGGAGGVAGNENVTPIAPCERYTIFHSLRDIPTSGVVCNFHLCEPHRHLPPWERYSMGYRPDSNIATVYDQFLRDPYVTQKEKDLIQVPLLPLPPSLPHR
jgi:hypothetical protein